MSNPRYVPRDCAVEPKLFGRANDLEWKSLGEITGMYPHLADTEPRGRALLLAARLQHRYARRIRGRLKATDTNLKSYAADAGVGYDRMVKVLRGSAVLRLEDIATADVLIGQVSELSIAEARVARLTRAHGQAAAAQRARDNDLSKWKAIRDELAKVMPAHERPQ